MNNQNGFAPIVIILIVVTLLAGGIWAWQYWEAPKEEVGKPEEKILEEKIVEIEPMEEITQIKVYFGNPQKEIEAGHPEIRCESVYPVIRTIPKTQAVARAAINELLKGPTAEEKNQEYVSSIPDVNKITQYPPQRWWTCEGQEMPFKKGKVTLLSLDIKDGTAFADFSGEIHAYGGGSCNVVAISSQIINTLKQFPTIEEVVISVDGEKECILQP